MMPSSYECPKCHRVSHHPQDVEHSYCGRCHVFLEDLRNEIVTDFAHLTDLVLTRKDCFSLAIMTLVSCGEGACRLVHAWVKSYKGEWIEHAWCETPATGTYEDGSEKEIVVMIDHTQPDPHARYLPVEFGYEKMQARGLRRYTYEEAIARALVVGHDGPWP